MYMQLWSGWPDTCAVCLGTMLGLYRFLMYNRDLRHNRAMSLIGCKFIKTGMLENIFPVSICQCSAALVLHVLAYYLAICVYRCYLACQNLTAHRVCLCFCVCLILKT